MKTRSTAARVIGELVVVFVGVLLALAADDFRETREERREARQSLAVMVADLRSDSTEYAQASRTNRRWAAAAGWAAENWGAVGIENDSAEIVLSDVGRLTTLELSVAGFDGLRSSNRIRLIDDESVRIAILRYYQTHQPRTIVLRDEVLEQRSALHKEGLTPHVENLLGANGPRLRLRTSWAQLKDDLRLHSQIVWFGRITASFAGRMTESEELAGDLIAFIEAALVTM